MKKWKTITSSEIIRDQWISLRADECELANGARVHPYYVLDEKEWVHVFALDAKDRVLVVSQYRYAADAVCVELPGGMVDAGESPLEAAKRELREETGYIARQWINVGTAYANPPRQTNSIHIFAARDLNGTGIVSFDPSEDIASQFMTLSELKQAISAGRFSHAMHIASFYMSLEALGLAGSRP